MIQELIAKVLRPVVAGPILDTDTTPTATATPAMATPAMATPVASADYTFTDQDTPVTFHILANDTDPDGGTLSISTVQNPTNGTVIINANKTITYIPDPGFFGTNIFYYGTTASTGGTGYSNIYVTVNEVTTPPPLPGTTFLSYNFDYGPESMTYTDAAFRAASVAGYSSGSLSDGALLVTLGGVNGDVIDDMSGGWSVDFFLTGAQNVIVTFDYSAAMAGSFESNEKLDVLLALDYGLVDIAGNDYVARYLGPDSAEDLETGWIPVEIDLGDLDGGQHILEIGAFLNRKNQSDEVATVLFDNLAIYTNDPAEPGTVIEPTPGSTTVRLTTGADVFKMLAKDEVLDGGFGNDDINGMGGDDLLFGSEGNDILKGASGVDELVGGDGRDTLYGSSGADTFWGGAGLDTMIGDGGGGGYADRFCFTDQDLDAVDRIRDFSVTDGDILDLSNLVTGFVDGVSDVTDFVKFTDIGTKTVVKVDMDGGGDSFHKLLFLNGVVGYEDEAQLYADGIIEL